MRLSDLARGVPGAAVLEGADYDVRRVHQDSRQAQAGDLFVAVPGGTVDGHDFAPAAAARGAAVAVEREIALPPGTAVVRVRDGRWDLGQLSAEHLGRPARALLMAGVTGTDGKTTTTHMATHVLQSAGMDAGGLSTVMFDDGRSRSANSSGLSTAGAPQVQEFLARLRDGGVRAAVIETTSHALVQGRVAACEFDVGAVTNVGVDHLDFHRTWAAYAAAKASLVELTAAAWPKGVPKTAVLNRDDAGFEILSRVPIERRWTYSLRDSKASFAVEDLVEFESGSRFSLLSPAGRVEIEIGIPARYNVQNAICAAAVCLALGLELDAIAAGLNSFTGVAGRLDAIQLGQPFRVVIDFAHSSGSLAATLAELRRFTPGRVLLVFGATGRADHDRAGMGRAAGQGSDFFFITTDDPVDQDPLEIAREVESGIEARQPGRDYAIVLDRGQAIQRALELAQPGDTVLLAGKGHEATMNFGLRHEPWDERSEVEARLRALGYR